MATRLSETYGAINETQLSEFESRHGLSLPQDYRDFLLQANGGRPEKTFVSIPGWPGDKTCVHFFFGIHGGEHNNLESWTTELGSDLPDGCIPIAVDMGGNFFCLGTMENRGQIWYWDSSSDHGLSAETGNMYKVAGSMLDFLGKLKATAD